MGDPLICSADQPDLSSQELACYAEPPVSQLTEIAPEIEPQGRIGFDPAEDYYTSSNPFSSQSEAVCRGSYKSLDDYLAQMDYQSRSSKIGPYLASMNKSAEEKIPTDPKVQVVPGQTYSLVKAWKGLPQDLRVYLD